MVSAAALPIPLDPTFSRVSVGHSQRLQQLQERRYIVVLDMQRGFLLNPLVFQRPAVLQRPPSEPKPHAAPEKLGLLVADFLLYFQHRVGRLHVQGDSLPIGWTRYTSGAQAPSI